MDYKIEVLKFKVILRKNSNLLATANILINNDIEIRGFTILHNKFYANPIVKYPAVKKNGKYTCLIKTHDQQLNERISQIINKHYEKTKAKK